MLGGGGGVEACGDIPEATFIINELCGVIGVVWVIIEEKNLLGCHNKW